MTTRIQLNKYGLRQIKKTPEIQALIKSHAERIASEAGEGYEVKPMQTTRYRVRIAVVASSMRARRAEARDRNLVRIVGTGVWKKGEMG